MKGTRANRTIAAILLSGGLCLSSGALAEDASGFFEPFDTIDSRNWFVSDGWANGPHQSCSWNRDQIAVQDGILQLSLTDDAKGDRKLSCAEIQSHDRYRFGTFEARIKVPYAPGMNANFFTFIGEPQNEPHNEIDFEFIARRGPMLQTNYHVPDSSENVELTKMQDDGEFRIISFIWEPERLRWYIDGELIRDTRGNSLPQAAQKIYLSIWSTDRLVDWMGLFEAKSAPQRLEVDWVVYTPLEASCEFDQSVLCREGVELSR